MRKSLKTASMSGLVCSSLCHPWYD